MKHKSREELFAQEIAFTLGDRESLSLYRSFVEMYPEPLLRKALNEVMAVPDAQIRKSRGALFTFLIHKYGQKSIRHPRH